MYEAQFIQTPEYFTFALLAQTHPYAYTQIHSHTHMLIYSHCHIHVQVHSYHISLSDKRNFNFTRSQNGRERAANARDALAMLLYSRLFDWIVLRINQTLNTMNEVRQFIGVLGTYARFFDMYVCVACVSLVRFVNTEHHEISSLFALQFTCMCA